MYIKKLVDAAKNVFVYRSIILGEIEELFRQNCGKEVHAFIGAKKVGNAKVIKCEDILKKQQLREKELEKKVPLSLHRFAYHSPS
jgi:hypothetical protein